MAMFDSKAVQELDLEKLMGLIDELAHEKQAAILKGDQERLAYALQALDQLCNERDRRRGMYTDEAGFSHFTGEET